MVDLKREKRAPLGRIALMTVAVLLWRVVAGTSWAGQAILQVITDPEGARVTVDTGEEGVTPCTLEVPEGKRSVQIRLPGHLPVSRQVEVSSGEPTELKLRLMPIPMTMRGSHQMAGLQPSAIRSQPFRDGLASPIALEK